MVVGAGRWTKRVLIALLLVLALLVVALLYFYSRIEKVDALQDYEGRPAAASGTNWLIVGSDSREGLSDQEVKDLHLGKIEGRRTDTIILLHKPESGAPTLVSLPRDSYVPIPGHGRDKLNAAYAFGGAPLLAQTVETVTGLHIDHYAEVGFGGFVGMTDAVGGVELCPKRKIKDRQERPRRREGLPGDGRRRPRWPTSGRATSTRRATSAGWSGSRSSWARCSTRPRARRRC